MNNQITTVDYAIVGAGVSGLYTAWRLLKDSGTKPTVRVFEQGDRVGGRLLTWNPGGDEAGFRAELGGMRFFEKQQLVRGLIGQLDQLKGQEVPFFADGHEGLIWRLRGLRMNAGDADTATSRYRLRPGEDIAPFTLLNRVIDKVLKQNGQVTPSDWKGWDEVKPKLMYGERNLWELGFWNLLANELSTEAYKYMVDAFGYYSLALNWNAAEAFQNVSLDFTQKPEYKTLSKGFDQIPKALKAQVEQLGGADCIQLNTTLVRFEADDTRPGGVLLVLERNGGTEQVRAKHLVLAMPRRSLELLEPSPAFNLRINTKLRELVRSSRSYPAFKLFLLYENRWWDQKGFRGQPIRHGRSVSDLPIRQTYYMRPDACEAGRGGSCPDYGLIMASYDDSVAVDFWQGMEPTDLDRSIVKEALAELLKKHFRNFSGGRQQRREWRPPPVLHLAPIDMIDHAREQLAILHGVKVEEVPQPTYGAFADWSLDPFGGGWHFWEPQANPKEVMPKIRRPLEGRNVHITGEAYSGAQGWVEGALTTAEHVVRNLLKDKKPPKWLEGIYLGW